MITLVYVLTVVLFHWDLLQLLVWRRVGGEESHRVLHNKKNLIAYNSSAFLFNPDLTSVRFDYPDDKGYGEEVCRPLLPSHKNM